MSPEWRKQEISEKKNTYEKGTQHFLPLKCHVCLSTQQYGEVIISYLGLISVSYGNSHLTPGCAESDQHVVLEPKQGKPVLNSESSQPCNIILKWDFHQKGSISPLFVPYSTVLQQYF